MGSRKNTRIRSRSIHNNRNSLLKPRFTKGNVTQLSMAIAILFASSPAFSQTTNGAPETKNPANIGNVQDVVVTTGTRDTQRSASESLSPIDVISGTDLQATGQTDLRDALVKLVPSVARQAMAGDAANLTSALTLRGLSPNHVLVLVNGKRRHTSANISADAGPQQGSTPVDIDLIPVSAIDHIEVLRDGAAAQYGSDAIAGVINIILKSSSRGGSVSTNAGQYYKGDGQTFGGAADIGVELGDKGFAHFSTEFRNHDHSIRSGIDNRTGRQSNPTLGDPEIDRQSFAFNAGYVLNNDVELYGFGTYAHRTGGSYQNNRLASTLPQIYPNGFTPVETILENDYAFTGGARGDHLGGWRWDISSTYGGDEVGIGMTDSANTSLFAATGSTPTSFHLAQYRNFQWTNNLDVGRPFELALLPAPLNVSLGAEHRQETYVVGAGDPASSFGSGAQALPGLSAISAGSHTRDVLAAYTDFSTKLTPRWEVDLAARFEHYSDAGNTTNAKFSTRYEIDPRLAVRATVSTGFRAPSLAQEYYTSLAVSPSTATGQLAVNSAAAKNLGATPLKPEKSTSFNIGIVAQPFDKLNVTVDAYQIAIKDRIVQGGTYTGQTAIDALTAASISLPPGLSAVSANYFTNGADTKTQGLDIVATYKTNLKEWGRIDWDLGANINTSKVTHTGTDANGRTLLNAQQIGYLTTSTPKNKIIVGGVWTNDKWGVSLHETRYGKTAVEATYYSGPNAFSSTQFNHVENAPKFITDLEVRYAFTKKFQVAVGANNLFNVYPTKLPAINQYLGVYQYDPSASQIGINGGYYYLRANYTF
ncbi:TonB-dependent siderophore receptor [Glaciimonas sp. PCH181]|uniref:TonB-dependent receptor plug domain-containing protein n=1 Tax=Glaciimonas sp. PCH181 TaxID=2133943 RepID=UPI000D3BFBC7|nr:TonB-dependent receptor [Glaciimonas sp. PCH181]PUA19657.1 TonB-dependent receptor [Glaciimonas sp. PCH181]